MSTGLATLLLAHLIATTAMAGLIWFVQVVHYPLFARIDPAGFVAYEQAHTTRTAFVVGVPMATEGFTALGLLLVTDDLGLVGPVAGLLLLGAVHASTVLLQVPCHRKLSSTHDPATIDRLVRTNWIRTLGWTSRVGLATWLLATQL